MSIQIPHQRVLNATLTWRSDSSIRSFSCVRCKSKSDGPTGIRIHIRIQIRIQMKFQIQWTQDKAPPAGADQTGKEQGKQTTTQIQTRETDRQTNKKHTRSDHARINVAMCRFALHIRRALFASRVLEAAIRGQAAAPNRRGEAGIFFFKKKRLSVNVKELALSALYLCNETK